MLHPHSSVGTSGSTLVDSKQSRVQNCMLYSVSEIVDRMQARWIVQVLIERYPAIEPSYKNASTTLEPAISVF